MAKRDDWVVAVLLPGLELNARLAVERMNEVRRENGLPEYLLSASAPGPRRFSAEARARMSAAQQKRWKHKKKRGA